MALTVLEKIDIAKISQYLSLKDIGKSGLFGKRLDQELPYKLYMERAGVEWEYENEGLTEGIRASGNILIESLPPENTFYEFAFNYPGIGVVILGEYVVQQSDTDTIILAANIAQALNDNSYGFTFIALGSSIMYLAPLSLGSSVNGQSVYLINDNNRIFDYTFDYTFN